jgi:hypothetical protein
MQAVIRSALEVYRRQRFLDEVNAAYADLQRDPRSWEAFKGEGAIWDQTLSDGLVAEPKAGFGVKRSNRKKRS